METYPEELLQKARRVGRMLNLLATVAPSTAGRIALRLFCTPRGKKFRDRDRDFLETAEKAIFHIENHFIQSYFWQPSVRLNDDVAPKKVLFLHGWESNAARWRKFVKAFREAGYAVQALDAPAHGASSGKVLNLPLYSRIIKGFIEKNGTPNVMVGHSVGASAVVMSLAVYETPHPRKAVVLGPFAESSRVLADFSKILQLSERTHAATCREIERLSGLSIEKFSVREKARSLVELPGLVMHDRDDKICPVEEGRQIAEAWGAQFVETQGLGHRMQDKTVVRAVLEFAQRAT